MQQTFQFRFAVVSKMKVTKVMKPLFFVLYCLFLHISWIIRGMILFY